MHARICGQESNAKKTEVEMNSKTKQMPLKCNFGPESETYAESVGLSKLILHKIHFSSLVYFLLFCNVRN